MTARKRDLVGRKIVDVEWNRWHDKNGWITDPVLILDNGRRVAFVTQELDQGGDYGTSIVITPPVAKEGR